MPRSFLVKKVKHPIDRWAYREPSSPSEAEPAPPCPPSPPSHQCLSVRYTSNNIINSILDMQHRYFMDIW
ncbi:hypothetical protein TNIN_189561 [Trichonephila inaurata madagascariensis]|uniref:Uncharacterized protein n=1 Tax=Trichonephila inaurata madagascariensis TaxID=2747483 RepID=A0A8X7CE76_9ARAC|nr:hypothetical protein TNIN_189561 [Trichonephila inaurata madagascariensis]